MNNSRLAVEYTSLSLDEPLDNTVTLREREAELVKILGAIRGVEETKEWSTLKEKVFDGLVDVLTKDIHVEARKEIPDTLKLNRLSGQLKWAERYSDLTKLGEVFRSELTNIRTRLNTTPYGKTKKD